MIRDTRGCGGPEEAPHLGRPSGSGWAWEARAEPGRGGREISRKGQLSREKHLVTGGDVGALPCTPVALPCTPVASCVCGKGRQVGPKGAAVSEVGEVSRDLAMKGLGCQAEALGPRLQEVWICARSSMPRCRGRLCCRTWPVSRGAGRRAGRSQRPGEGPDSAPCRARNGGAREVEAACRGQTGGRGHPTSEMESRVRLTRSPVTPPLAARAGGDSRRGRRLERRRELV